MPYTSENTTSLREEEKLGAKMNHLIFRGNRYSVFFLFPMDSGSKNNSLGISFHQIGDTHNTIMIKPKNRVEKHGVGVFLHNSSVLKNEHLVLRNEGSVPKYKSSVYRNEGSVPENERPVNPNGSSVPKNESPVFRNKGSVLEYKNSVSKSEDSAMNGEKADIERFNQKTTR